MSLINIQQKLKAPKGQYNSFAKYHYRSCEDILEALKPVLQEYNYTLVISDEVVAVGDRVYVKATCVLRDEDGTVIAENTGFAREALSKKGMDDSQITGTSSSYARKYSLNGMFLIDDTKDADTDEHANQNKPRISHNNKLKKYLEAMNKANDLEKLKLLAREATNYFEDWSQHDCVKEIRAKFMNVSSRFATDEDKAA